jgi:hypothetical protein
VSVVRSKRGGIGCGIASLIAFVLLSFAGLAGSAAAAECEPVAKCFGIASVSAELSSNHAGAHPDFITNIEMKTDSTSPTDPTGLKAPYGQVKDLTVTLPPGLLGNLNAVDTCSTAQFVTALSSHEGCTFGSQVGVAVLHVYGFNNAFTVSIFNLETSGTDDVARLGFYVLSVPAFIEVHVRSEDDYGVTAEVTGISSIAQLVSVKTTLWGVPADHSHDTQRLTPEESQSGSSSPARSSGKAPAPFMTNPTTCGEPLAVGFSADSYQEPGKFDQASTSLGTFTECGKLEFKPSFSLIPTNREAAAPSGADALLEIPQNEAVNGLASSHLRNTVVKLPAGLTIAAGAADGLEACSAAEVGYKVSPPVASNCPAASKVATAEIDSPALSRPIEGAVYQRTPEPGHITRAWLVADELGVHVKLPGEFQLDPNTGRITSLFLETPQVPVRQFKLHFKGGARGVLATPDYCGTYRTEYDFSPWSGAADVTGTTPMTFDQHCTGGGFAPKLSAGTVSSSAAGFSSFITDLIQESGEQNLAGLSIDLPQGLLAKLAGVGVCSGAAAAAGNCPAASQIGTVAVATGPGPSPLWIPQPGKAPTAVYLAGPYKGAPYSIVVKTPAQAGPFDLGTVVVRAAIEVDPVTAQVSVVSDPLPQFLEGIPVDYRAVHVAVDRRDFILNPTSCDSMQIAGTARSAAGATAALSSRFQAANCAKLRFRPKLSLKLTGGTRRNDNPALRATLTMPGHGANIARTQVALPHSEFLDQAHIRTICTRVQFAAGSCPRGAVYGWARASTPLLDQPLEGPVYLRSSDNLLPDLVVALRGPQSQPIEIDLAGRTDSFHGGIRNTFDVVPDAPLSKFTLKLFGGKRGLIVNSRDLCKGPKQRATARFSAHNGVLRDFRPLVKNDCGEKKTGRRTRR